MIVRPLFLFLIWAAGAQAQGFAGLGTEATGFDTPTPGTDFAFPADHGPHPSYRIEWWYLTANLETSDGTPYGIQWTLFRSALQPEERMGWASPQIWIGHAGLTTPDHHYAAERLSRGGIGTAGVTAAPFHAWIDDWSMEATGEGISEARLTASAVDFAYDLRLQAEGPLVPQGQGGYSVKSPAGQASYYYSQPFYRVQGTLTLPDGSVEVTGQGWLDREWSSQPLAETQDGWDWISLHLDSGAKLMGFRLRDRAGPDYTSATWIAADGTPTPYGDGALTLTPVETTKVAGRQVPVIWRVELPDQGLDTQIEAVMRDAWMDLGLAQYWEGPVRIADGGMGYLEMTGYPPED